VGRGVRKFISVPNLHGSRRILAVVPTDSCESTIAKRGYHFDSSNI
jgi:hypothetical protein